MSHRPLAHLSDSELLNGVAALLAEERQNTAHLLADIAEFDHRQLYREAGHPSMLAYCLNELHLDEDTVPIQICAARAAREFPAIFEAVADGRLHLEACSSRRT